MAEGFESIVYSSSKLAEIINIAKRVAPSNAIVLITGESGTGKEIFASAIHKNSHRANKPFITVNCAAVPDSLLESELFGHEKGSFTGATNTKKGKFELANSGTLFLDEIGDMSIAAQAKILRSIEEKHIERVGGQSSIPIDIRILAATNQPLLENVQSGKFRNDLYYRLNEVHISLPPLRERKEDIPTLVNHFIEYYNQQYSKDIKGISNAALEFLMRHDWPGNIRELQNVIKCAMLIMEGDTIWIEHNPLDIHINEPPKEPEEGIVTKADSLLGLLTLDEVEKRHILRILELTGWNKSQTANILNISRPTLDRKIEKYELEEMRKFKKFPSGF